MTSATVPTRSADWRDYLALTKPIVVSLLLVTTLAAMIVATGGFPEVGLVVWTMLGGALTAGGASAVNQYIDREIDGQMQRTRQRPLPQGRLDAVHAIVFGCVLSVMGLLILAWFVNPLSAALALLGWLYYVLLYSLVLKQRTPQNIVLGGGAGAIPPLVGWAAATGELSISAFFLFALVFFWTPPHFWALALLKRQDYARAGVPMFPVVYGELETRQHVFLYTLQLVALTLLLPLAELGGWLYITMAILIGAGLVFQAWKLWREGGNLLAWRMYKYTSFYLAFIFFALVLDTFLISS